MLASVAFENFMSLRKVEVPLEPLTVLVGPNASGKTSVLRGLQLITGRVRELGWPAPTPGPSIGDLCSKGAEQEGMKLALREEAGAEGLRMFFEARWDLPTVDWQQETRVSLGSEVVTFDAQKQARTTLPPSLHSRLLGLRVTQLLHLDATVMARPTYSDEAEPRIGADGSGLAAALAEMAAAQPERMDALQAALRAVVPSVRQVRIPRRRIDQTEWQAVPQSPDLFRQVQRLQWGHEILFDTQGATGIPAHLASEGTLLTLGLLAILHGEAAPRLVLLDDIDRGLHPRAQGDLIKNLRALMARDSALQIVATSHSPYLVEHLRPEEVRITVSEDGWTRCGRLTDHPDYPKWKDQMTPGEFWSSVGEDWLKDRRV